MPHLTSDPAHHCALVYDLKKQRFIFISPDTFLILGFDPGEFYQNKDLFSQIIHPNDKNWIDALTADLKLNQSVNLNYRIKTPANEEKWIQEKRTIVKDQQSGHNVLLSIITSCGLEKQETEKNQFDDTGFFYSNPNPMWIYSLSSLRILKVNRAAIERYGYTEGEFLKLTARDLLPVSEIEKFDNFNTSEIFSDTKQTGIIYRGVWKHQNKNGGLIYAEITSQDILFDGDDCRIVAAVNVTEKISFEEELTWTKNNLEALINNTEDQIWSLDKDCRYVYMNKAYQSVIEQFTGIEPKEGEYSYLHAGFSAEIVEKWSKYYNRVLAGERYIIINESLNPRSNKIHSFEISFNPIFKNKGEITGIGCFARDITERLNTEKEIVNQNERLRKIASLSSHELRRPVASLIGLIDIMDKENFYNPENKEILERLLTVSNELDKVIRLIVDKTFTDEQPLEAILMNK